MDIKEINFQNINTILPTSQKLKQVKPFLKWAGGKRQLLPILAKTLPEELYKGDLIYVEPFIGSGALFFWILNNIPQVKEIIINDANKELVNVYKVIKKDVFTLIDILKEWEKEYHSLEKNQEEKKIYYLQKRKTFNLKISNSTTQAALFIFLNRTCFNGLYRVNQKGEFNVPMGKYTKPTICDMENLINISEKLKNVQILDGDFEEVIPYVKKRAFFYFDPPYKPITQTSNFTAYYTNGFKDKDQIRLKNFCDKINAKNHLWMLSNSDLQEKDEGNTFFDKLYANYFILRISARRNINSNAKKRGKINELLITNYEHQLLFKGNT